MLGSSTGKAFKSYYQICKFEFCLIISAFSFQNKKEENKNGDVTPQSPRTSPPKKNPSYANIIWQNFTLHISYQQRTITLVMTNFFYHYTGEKVARERRPSGLP